MPQERKKCTPYSLPLPRAYYQAALTPGTLLPQRHNGPAAQEETRRTLYFFLLREKETLKAFSGVSTQESQAMTPVILPSGVR